MIPSVLHELYEPVDTRDMPVGEWLEAYLVDPMRSDEADLATMLYTLADAIGEQRLADLFAERRKSDEAQFSKNKGDNRDLLQNPEPHRRESIPERALEPADRKP